MSVIVIVLLWAFLMLRIHIYGQIRIKGIRLVHVLNAHTIHTKPLGAKLLDYDSILGECTLPLFFLGSLDLTKWTARQAYPQLYERCEELGLSTDVSTT